MSSRRKSEVPKHIATTANLLPIREPVQWSDPMRGILIALLQNKPAMWDSRLRPTKEGCLRECETLAEVLRNQVPKITAMDVLEKICWMMEMYVRACESTTWQWRYVSAMSFIGSIVGNGSHYLYCLSDARLVELTSRYAVEAGELDAIRKAPPSRRFKRKDITWYFKELQEFAQLEAEVIGEGCVVKMEDGIKLEEMLAQTPPVQLIITQNSTATESTPSSQHTQAPVEVMCSRTPVKAPVKRGRPPKNQTCLNSGPVVDNINGTSNNNMNIKSALEASGLIKTEMPLLSAIVVSNGKALDNIPIAPKPLLTNQTSGSSNSSVNGADYDNGSPSTSPAPKETWKWTNPMIFTLIDAVRDRPALWHTGHPHFKILSKRKELFAEVSQLVSAVSGSHTVTEDHINGKWKFLQDGFAKIHKNGGAHAQWDLYQPLAFLSPEIMNSLFFTENNGMITMHGPTNGYGGNQNESTDAKSCTSTENNSTGYQGVKRARLSPKCPQVITWMPPREDSIAGVMQAMMPNMSSPHSSTAPMATAQITSTSNGSLSSLLMREANRMTNSSNSYVVTNGSIKESHSTDDKWKHMGRLIEETCRDIEKSDPVAAVHLQKEINDVVHRYQLKAVESMTK